jgi:3-dehydroquinate synthase
LSSIDSSIGGKCGVNLPIGKNLIGSFHQPKAVFTDTSLLETLPQREWRSGFAEVIKYAILNGGKLWSLLQKRRMLDFQRSPESLQTLILECLKIKRKFIEKDERDHGDRKLLNLGHTMAHAMEALSAYKKLSHGEAVAQGLYFAADLSVQRKLCSGKTAQKIYNLLKRYDFYRQAIPKQAFSFMKNDKKRIGSQLEWILVEKIGQCSRWKLFRNPLRTKDSFLNRM